MKQERDDAVLKVAKLEGMIAGAGKPPADGELSGTIPVIGTEPLIPYKDITKMSKEELLEWFEDDPIGYEANRFAQFVHEGEILRAQREESVKRTNTIKQTFDNYEKDNPDFKEAWESGKIKQFMDAHPGHNAISAHMMMSKSANRQSEVEKIQAQIDQAVNAAVEKERKNFAAKRNADTIGDGSGGVKTGAGANELADTKSQGGLISAISARLAKSRQAA
jgi:tRNA(Ile)-lysidine synthase TilS/MesJ